MEHASTYSALASRERLEREKGDSLLTSKGSVVIGNDCWIGTEVMILSGVNIGHGAVIGARAVVSKDVPPYAVVVGNPARVVKFRFAEDIIERLLTLQWWDWSADKILALRDVITGDVETLLAYSSSSEL